MYTSPSKGMIEHTNLKASEDLTEPDSGTSLFITSKGATGNDSSASSLPMQPMQLLARW